ncbi:hypothetical protein [Okeania sp.]|uniref:hypothetical protein n=1 Tax=Okeania sp. TaxID=3100323 RepID=UPI002B4B94F4|nr:hypothetical protein [Okeania sp.]MEB3341070.1 hypothetical protein [Okeania sp.]
MKPNKQLWMLGFLPQPNLRLLLFIIDKEVELNNHNHDYLLGFVPQPNLRLLVFYNK